MKHKIILLTAVFLLCLIHVSFAQKELRECGTQPFTLEEAEKQPWYGNNQYLLNLVDSIEGTLDQGNMRTEAITRSQFLVPVQAHVWHRSDGTGEVPEDWQIMSWINRANEVLKANNVSITLYMLCDVDHNNRDEYYDQISNDAGWTRLFNSRRNVDALNVHFLRGSRDNVFGVGQRPRTFNRYSSFAIITDRTIPGDRNQDILDPNNIRDVGLQDGFIGTFIHEMGHAFTLSHTHEVLESTRANADANRCHQEYVDRRKVLAGHCIFTGSLFGDNLSCEYNGDRLCDTPADPDLTLGIEERWVENCNYTPTRIIGGTSVTIREPQDHDGIDWQPSALNFMSYTTGGCRLRAGSITRMQRGVMYDCIRDLGISIGYQVDEYENDNHFRVADRVELGQFPRRHHTFHENNGGIAGGVVDWRGCDEDWITFTVTSTRNVIIMRIRS